MTNTDIQKDSYMPGLDGLRALAVFAVIAFHLSLPFAPGGFLGVTLFFVLSGYLITDIMLSGWQREQKIDLKTFFIRRAKRLLPSVFFLLICLSAYITIFRPELLANLKSAFLPAAFFFSNWWYIFQKVPYFGSSGTPSLLTHFWSLAVEVQFYFIWPFLLLLLQRFVHRRWVKVIVTASAAVLSAVLMAVLYQPGGDPGRIYYGTDTRVFSLLLGACLAFLYPSARLAALSRSKPVQVLSDVVGGISLLGVLLMAIFMTQYDDFLYRGGMFVFSVASMLLIAAAANPSTLIGRLFSFRPLRFVGKISYGVYLWQYPVIVITNTLFPSSRINAVLSICQVAATILFATISYYLIEKPIRRSRIIPSLRKNTFREFCKGFLHTRWWEKTAVLLVITLVLISGIGFLNAQAVPSSIPDELSAMPSQMIINPDDTPAASPSAAATPSAPQNGSPTGSPQSSDPPASSQSPSPAQSPDTTPGSSTSPETSEEIIPSDLCITLIGDSIGIDIAPYLQKYYPKMQLDAEVGRQFYKAKSIIKQLIQKNKLTSTVVIELGSNGTVSESQMRDLIELIGSDKKIVFVNTQVPRSWCDSVNNTLKKITAEYSNTTVADWYSVSLDKSEYFYKDGFHPNATGSPILAKVISEAIDSIQPYKPYMPVEKVAVH